MVAITDTLRRRGQDLAEAVAGADVVVTSYTLFRLDFDAYAAADVVRADPGRGAVRQEPPVQGLPVRAAAAGAVQAGHHRHADGEQPDGAVVAAVDHRARAVPAARPGSATTTPGRSRSRRDAELLAQLRRRIKPLMLRRTKEQVAADLPAKQEQVLERRAAPAAPQRLPDAPAAGAAEGPRPARRRRQEPVHDPALAHPAAAAEPGRRAWSTPSTTTCRRAKIDALLEQLADVVAGGHRALVFSQFTGFLAQVRDRLDAAGHRATATSTAAPATAPTVVARFKDGTAPVFLISLKAGGFGLNLTEADYCFLLDPWWNPATEAQAVDRTHRIGQTRNVMVYRLIAKDTIEEKVMALKPEGRAVRQRDGRRQRVRVRAERRRHPRAGLLSVSTRRWSGRAVVSWGGYGCALVGEIAHTRPATV